MTPPPPPPRPQVTGTKAAPLPPARVDTGVHHKRSLRRFGHEVVYDGFGLPYPNVGSKSSVTHASFGDRLEGHPLRADFVTASIIAEVQTVRAQLFVAWQEFVASVPRLKQDLYCHLRDAWMEEAFIRCRQHVLKRSNVAADVAAAQVRNPPTSPCPRCRLSTHVLSVSLVTDQGIVSRRWP